MGRVAAVPAGNAHVDASKRSFRRVNALQTHTHTHIHSLAHTQDMAYSLWLMALMWPLLMLRSSTVSDVQSLATGPALALQIYGPHLWSCRP